MIPQSAAPKSSSSVTQTTIMAPRDGFVPPLIDRPEDAPGCYRLFGMGQRWGLSIESAELVFTDNRDRERSVYGTIYINSKFFKVHTVYNRSSSEAETVSGGGGGHLSLCGPKYFVDTYSPTAVYVDLREVGNASPFINQRVSLPLSGISPNRSISIPVEALSREAILIIHMTVICPSVPTNISLELSYPDSYKEWFVSGRVTAIQTIKRGKKTRSVCLFNRRTDDPVRAKDRISPHRNVFVSPLLFEKSYIEKVDEVLAEAGHPSSGMVPDDDYYNGVGSYLSIDVDLKFVDSVDEAKSCLVRGVFHYQFKCTHEHKAQFRAILKGPILREKKEPKLPRLSTDIDEDEIEVALTLVPYIESVPNMVDEIYETKMSLYVEPDIEPLSSDSSSSSSGFMFSDNKQAESKGEESNEPVNDQMDDESSKPITDHK